MNHSLYLHRLRAIALGRIFIQRAKVGSFHFMKALHEAIPTSNSIVGLLTIDLDPTKNLEISEVGMTELVRCCRFVLELIGRLDDDEGWACDEVVDMYELARHPFHESIGAGG